MNLSNDLLKEFVKSTHDEVEKKEGTTCYGTARFDDGDYVLLDGATTPTPATFMVNAVSGDRVLCSIKNHKLIVTANVTNPMMTLGLLKANTGIIVGGYLTTNENRLTYDDQAHNGLTFSAGGLGAYGGSGKYWYVKNTGELYASSADISGRITAKEGFIGTSAKGFIIDESSIYSGTKNGTDDGNLTISNADFKRSINGTQREGLRFALGSKFGVTSSGKIYASDADISGKITSSSGSLGNFTLGTAIYSGNKNELTSPNAGVYLGTNGISLGAGSTFKVTSAGELTATSGTIGPWSVTTTALYKTNSTFGDEHSLYFGDLGLSLTNKFKVTNAGALTATSATVTGSITAESGYLGTAANGFTIDQYGIFSGTKTGTNAGNITLANGSFSRTIGGSSSPITDLRFAIGANFGVTDSGVLYAAGAHISGEVEADSGSIGPWSIASDAIYKLPANPSQADITAKGYRVAEGAYLGDNGFSMSDKFWITASGAVYSDGENGASFHIMNTSTQSRSVGISFDIGQTVGAAQIALESGYLHLDSLGSIAIVPDDNNGEVWIGRGGSSNVKVRTNGLIVNRELQWAGESVTIRTGQWVTGSTLSALDAGFVVTLPKGKYLVLYGADFDPNANGSRMVTFNASSQGAIGTRYTPSCRAADGSMHTRLIGCVTANPSIATEYMLSLYQNSGTDLSVMAWYRIIRLFDGGTGSLYS